MKRLFAALAALLFSVSAFATSTTIGYIAGPVTVTDTPTTLISATKVAAGGAVCMETLTMLVNKGAAFTLARSDGTYTTYVTYNGVAGGVGGPNSAGFVTLSMPNYCSGETGSWLISNTISGSLGSIVQKIILTYTY